MNEQWVRSPKIEDSYNELHHITPQVYFFIPQSRGVNKVKLVFGGKEILLTERLENGLTKDATLEYNGEKYLYTKVIDAEQAATKILRE